MRLAKEGEGVSWWCLFVLSDRYTSKKMGAGLVSLHADRRQSRTKAKSAWIGSRCKGKWGRDVRFFSTCLEAMPCYVTQTYFRASPVGENPTTGVCHSLQCYCASTLPWYSFRVVGWHALKEVVPCLGVEHGPIRKCNRHRGVAERLSYDKYR